MGAKRFSPGSAPVANHTGLAEPLFRTSRSWSNATGLAPATAVFPPRARTNSAMVDTHQIISPRQFRKLPTYEQFLVLAFAQLTWRESLRDIETCLASFGPKLYHAGIRQPTARNTLAVVNEMRDWRIFADFADFHIQQATMLYPDEPFRLELQAAYALDSTTVDLCLSLFPWATFDQYRRTRK